MTRLSLIDEFVLFLVNEQTGGLLGSEKALKLALGGAVLMDLELTNRIDSDLETLILVDSTPLGDETLDPTLADISESPANREITFWIERTAERADEILDQAIIHLVERKILAPPDDDGYLAMTHDVARARRHSKDEGIQTESVRLRITRVLLDEEIPTPREIAIISLANACGVFGGILSPSELSDANERIELLTRMSPVGEMLVRLLHVIEPASRLETENWSKNLPRVPRWPLIGNGIEMAGDTLAFLTRNYLQLGSVFQIRLFMSDQTVLAGPDANRFLMRRERFYLHTGAYVEGVEKELRAKYFILGMNGPEHRRMREVMKSSFAEKLINSRLSDAVEIVRRHLAHWPMNKPIGGLSACQRITTDQVGTIAAGTSPEEYLDDLIYYFRHLMLTRVAMRLPASLGTPKFFRVRKRVEEFCKKILIERQLSRRLKPVDLIDNLLELHRVDPLFMPEGDLTMATLTPFIVGLDTSASTVASMLYAILKHPELQKRARDEADRLFSEGIPTPEGVKQLDVIRRIAMEAMRMYPVLPAMVRTVGSSFEFDGYHIPPSERLLFATTVTHYLEEFFPDPNRFDIDRYLPERSEHRQAAMYVPFGLGSHRCLGSGFAQVQVAIVVATLLHDTVLELDPPNYTMKVVQAPFSGPDRRFRFRLVSRRN